jgi:hypothetical protein
VLYDVVINSVKCTMLLYMMLMRPTQCAYCIHLIQIHTD